MRDGRVGHGEGWAMEGIKVFTAVSPQPITTHASHGAVSMRQSCPRRNTHVGRQHGAPTWWRAMATWLNPCFLAFLRHHGPYVLASRRHKGHSRLAHGPLPV